MPKNTMEGEDAIQGLRLLDSNVDDLIRDLKSCKSLSAIRSAMDCLESCAPITYGAPHDSFILTIKDHTGGKISTKESQEILDYLKYVNKASNKREFNAFRNDLQNYR